MAAGAASGIVRAQDRTPLRIIVALGPGSGSDYNARYVAKLAEPLIGRPIVVENLPGGDMMRAVQALLNSPADGNTVLVISPTSVVIDPVINPQLPYDPKRDIRPIAGLTRGAASLVTSTEGKFKSLGEAIIAAKRSPGTVSVGTYGHHFRIGAALIAKAAGVEFNMIPYKGGSELATAVVGGSLDLALLDVGPVIPLVRAKKLIALATTGSSRQAELPEVMSVREANVGDYELYGWAGLAVRSSTPEPSAMALETVFRKVTASPEFADFLNSQKNGQEVVTGSGKELAAMIESEIRRYRALPPEVLKQQ